MALTPQDSGVCSVLLRFQMAQPSSSVNGPCPAGESKTKTIRLEIHPNELVQVQPQWGEKKAII